MMVIVTGGSGSGKSSYAEKRITNLFGKHVRHTIYYLATMKVYGEEGQRKVERHRKMRAGKGFVTIEQTTDIHRSLEKIKAESGETGILLECMSNLVANEMFADGKISKEAEVVEKIYSDIVNLKKEVKHLVIVTNNVFEDGICYEKETMAYISALGEINRKLAIMAEEVWEIVAGIPVLIQ